MRIDFVGSLVFFIFMGILTLSGYFVKNNLSVPLVIIATTVITSTLYYYYLNKATKQGEENFYYKSINSWICFSQYLLIAFFWYLLRIHLSYWAWSLFVLNCSYLVWDTCKYSIYSIKGFWNEKLSDKNRIMIIFDLFGFLFTLILAIAITYFENKVKLSCLSCGFVCAQSLIGLFTSIVYFKYNPFRPD